MQRHVKEERGRYGQREYENRPSLVMAWFVCFHIYGREHDPKVNLGQILQCNSDSQMSLLVLSAKNICLKDSSSSKVTNESLHSHSQTKFLLSLTLTNLILYNCCMNSRCFNFSPPHFAYFSSVDVSCFLPSLFLHSIFPHPLVVL